MVIGIQSQLVLPRCSWVHILALVMYNVWVNGDWYPEPVSVPTIFLGSHTGPSNIKMREKNGWNDFRFLRDQQFPQLRTPAFVICKLRVHLATGGVG